MASELRWILIGFGIVLLAAIYLWGRRSARTVASEDAVVRVRPEPSFAQSEPSLGARLSEPRIDPREHDEAEEPVAPITAARVERTAEMTAMSAPVERMSAHDPWRGRLEPTFSESAPTEELPVRQEASPAPTLSSSEAPQARRVERRKILALRLAAAPQRIDGARLLEAFEAESLQHGKYQIFHRLHDDGGILFSVASMVEPGAFEPEKMASMQFPGVTLFAQLPGPTPGMHALNELVACARKLQQTLGGTLQDDRGVPLTVHRIERLRQEVREFERPTAARS